MEYYIVWMYVCMYVRQQPGRAPAEPWKAPTRVLGSNCSQTGPHGGWVSTVHRRILVRHAIAGIAIYHPGPVAIANSRKRWRLEEDGEKTEIRRHHVRDAQPSRGHPAAVASHATEV